MTKHALWIKVSVQCVPKCQVNTSDKKFKSQPFSKKYYCKSLPRYNVFVNAKVRAESKLHYLFSKNVLAISYNEIIYSAKMFFITQQYL